MMMSSFINDCNQLFDRYCEPDLSGEAIYSIMQIASSLRSPQ